MKVIVTGGLGYIGSHVVTALSKAGHTSIIVDNLSRSSNNVLDVLTDIASNWSFYEADVRDGRTMRGIFDHEMPDAVIHLAGFKSVSESIEEPMLYWNTNVGSAMILLEIMAEKGVRKLVFSSSCTVYGDSPMPLNESSRTGYGISNPYGTTKYVIEKMLENVMNSQLGWQITSLRYFNPIGNRDDGKLGDSPTQPESLMPHLLKVAADNRRTLKVYGDNYPTPDGSCIRDFVHVEDLAEAHVIALERLVSSGNIEVYNLGCGKGTSVLQLIKHFEEATGVRVPYEIVDRRPGDLAEVYADVRKAKAKLGWEAKKTVQEACKDAWMWQLNNPDGYESKK